MMKGVAYSKPDPVYTEQDWVSFHTDKMEEKTMYAVYWKDKTWALRKDGFNIEFYTLEGI